ncbi:four-carbon acid sugar kinase family protein [Streptomyces sp. NPDC004752]
MADATTQPASDPLAQIRGYNEQSAAWFVILDDDPTGAQAVHGVTVLIEPGIEELHRAAARREPTFVWTNSRSLSRLDAEAVNRETAQTALKAAQQAGVRPVFVSRSDSTLRGHFASELAVLRAVCAEAGQPVDAVVFVPAFVEAGRVTEDDVQWVLQDGVFVAAAQTEFAHDATFGYTERDLRSWVAARLGQPVEAVKSVPLDALRDSAGHESAKVITSACDGAVVIGNARTAADLEALALACQTAEQAGRRLLYRTGPSFVRALIGQPPGTPLAEAGMPDLDLAVQEAEFGLTVVGSHTALTSSQLQAAVRRHGLTTVELDVDALLASADGGEKVIADCAATLEQNLRHAHSVLVTSRTVRTVADDREGSLAVARQVSDAVCSIVARLPADLPLRYVVAKGGITSHEVAVRGLGMRQARVMGQMFPGQVSVLRLGADTARPGLPYVVFPGNVGSADTLADVLSLLEGDQSALAR